MVAATLDAWVSQTGEVTNNTRTLTLRIQSAEILSQCEIFSDYPLPSYRVNSTPAFVYDTIVLYGASVVGRLYYIMT
jgi:hypothetical protein